MLKKGTIPPLREQFPAPWPAIWAWIYLTNIILGLVDPGSTTLMIIRVGGIFLCLAYAIKRFPKDHLLHLALLATSIADVFLAANNTAETGIFIFLIAQVLHLVRLDGGKRARTPLIIFCIIGVLALVGNLYFQNVQIIYVICGFYLATILMNIYFSYQWYIHNSENPRAFMALAGFILFLCCDTCTAISYLSLNHMFAAFFYAPANYFAWLFYYPSQILVSNSSKICKNAQKCAKIIPKGR